MGLIPDSWSTASASVRHDVTFGTVELILMGGSTDHHCLIMEHRRVLMLGFGMESEGKTNTFSYDKVLVVAVSTSMSLATSTLVVPAGWATTTVSSVSAKSS